jgi:hypothetical protein
MRMPENSTTNSTASNDSGNRQPLTTTRTVVEDQATTLVRYYAIAGLVTFFIIVTSVAFIVRQFAINQLVQAAEDRSDQLASQFLRESRAQHKDFVTSSSELSASEIQESPEYARLDEIMMGLAEDDEVVRINLYDEEGFVAYSTESSEIGQIADSEEAFPDQYQYYWRYDGLISERTRFSTFNAISGPLENRQIVTTYMWLDEFNRDDEEGVIGVFRDITAAYRRISRTQLAVTGVAFLIMVIPGTRLLLSTGQRRHQA